VLLLQASNVASGVSNAAVMVTIPWLVLEVTDSASAAGLVVAIAAIGMKTGIKQMVDMGWKASLFLVLLTLAIAIAAGGGVLLAGH
jgi:uncharacterized membrane protein YadS